MHDRDEGTGGVRRAESAFGHWSSAEGLPVFEYTADPRPDGAVAWETVLHGPTVRHWLGVGNRRLQVFFDNEGTCGLWDEHDGLRWLTSAETGGTGVSVIDVDGDQWGTSSAMWPGDVPPQRQFGPTWFTVTVAGPGITLKRTTFCLEGEQPWILVHALVENTGGERTQLELTEEWALRPRFLQLATTREQRAAVARRHVAYEVARSSPPGTVTVRELFVSDADSVAHGRPLIFGAPRSLTLETLGESRSSAMASATPGPEPVLRVTVPVELGPGQRWDAWFRFGLTDTSPIPDPDRSVERSLASLRRRLPHGSTDRVPHAAQELTWHAALLTGGACRDGVFGGHTLDQSSTYSMELGFNGAARDPLQHALPLVYLEPDLALSVLRNTTSWGDPHGRIPWATDGSKRACSDLFDPSDQSLWSLWLAAEYAAATGDLAAFGQELPLRWERDDPPQSLHVQLRRQFRYFVDEVGRGEHGHVRIMNADWNDLAIEESGVDRDAMVQHGESVLNSAMAAWVLPLWASLCRRLGDETTATEASALGEDLRRLVAGEWNGRWFRRAYGPGVAPIGDDSLWLETQPWAILCGAADVEQGRALLHTIDQTARDGSPLGARVKWPPPSEADSSHVVGEGTLGGIWYSINMTLVWAAARLDPELAWDEWRRMTLAAHASAYPEIWEGTLSGPDSYNAPESPRPGSTWAHKDSGIAMQAFPVNNLHSHSQPLLSYLRLLGVEPTSDGALRVGGGGHFASSVFQLDEGGHGCCHAIGPVTIQSDHGAIEGGPGEVTW